jgi:hypothetical protein
MNIFEIDSNSDFSINNIPFGIFSLENNTKKRCGTRFGLIFNKGDFAVDLE